MLKPLEPFDFVKLTHDLEPLPCLASKQRCSFPLDKDVDRRRILNSFVGRTGAGLDEMPHESHPKYEALLARNSVLQTLRQQLN